MEPVSIANYRDDTLWAVVASIGRTTRVAEVFSSRLAALADQAWREQQVTAYANFLRNSRQPTPAYSVKPIRRAELPRTWRPLPALASYTVSCCSRAVLRGVRPRQATLWAVIGFFQISRLLGPGKPADEFLELIQIPELNADFASAFARCRDRYTTFPVASATRCSRQRHQAVSALAGAGRPGRQSLC